MIRLIPIHPENLKLAMKDVQGFITDMLEHADGKYTLSDVQKMIQDQSIILWVVYNESVKKAIGCVLTQIIEYPQSKTLWIFGLGGEDLEQILECMDDLKEYAKGISCDSIEFQGRNGWERALRSLNFDKTHIIMRLTL